MERTSKYYNADGTHRVPLWRMAGFALNNTATNLYLFMMMPVAYYLTGFVGVAVVAASSFSMFMRIWDGVTDPFVGYILDKTNGKFGKNRPFMIVGNIILFVSSYILFHVTHLLPENKIIRFGFFIVISAIYYIGYTFQCVVTKSAQSCLTNDPKQRPLFSVFDGAYVTIMFVVAQAFLASLGKKYGTMESAELFHELWLTLGLISALLTVIAVICISPKDKPEFFGTGNPVRIKFKDYWDTLKNNRAIQMLVVAASTDKLAVSAKTSTVTLVMYAIVAGNFALSGIIQGLTSIPTAILTMVVVATVATKLGQKRALYIGSVGGIITGLLLSCLWIFGDPRSMSTQTGALAWSTFTIMFVVLSIVWNVFSNLAGNIVIPMTADCADFEVYRSGRYVPGMMGTLFSFVDKIISSFAPMIAGLIFALIGFKDKLPDIQTPYSSSLLYAGVFLMFGMLIIGQTFNIIAMKFYPLTKEKMQEIQNEIAAIKASSKIQEIQSELEKK